MVLRKGALAAALIYLALLTAWLLNGYGVFGDEGVDILIEDAAGFVIIVGGGIVAGLAIGRWPAVVLPVLTLAAGIALDLLGRDATSGYAEDYPPLKTVALIVLPFGCVAVAAGVFVAKLRRPPS